jgi:hypothetical protein
VLKSELKCATGRIVASAGSPSLLFGVLLVAFTATFRSSVLARSNLLTRSWALAFLGIALLALAGILTAIEGRSP